MIADPTKKTSKKRKAEGDEPEDPAAPSKKKPKAMGKVTKGRFKGPVDYDKQCGVINDKNLPCSRSLTCKSHSMGAKRAVQGRSKPYDELLLEWNRANNPNWVEPVKRESKAEKKEKREKEKAEKKRLAMEAAAAAGVDITKKGVASAWGAGTKKGGKKAAAAAAARLAEGDDGTENYDDIDSEAEVDALVHSVRAAQDKGVIGVPLAMPCDASSWFVHRRERLRNCRDLLANALAPAPNRNGIATNVAPGIRLG
jgi:SAGA-associated factor 73